MGIIARVTGKVIARKIASEAYACVGANYTRIHVIAYQYRAAQNERVSHASNGRAEHLV